MKRPLHTSASDGFTLLELLVAVAVFALMAVMAYGGLDSVVRQSEIVEGEADRLAEFQNGLHRLRADLGMAIDRPVRDSGGSPERSFVGEANDGRLLAFTRLGSANPWLEPRGQIERVEWRFHEGSLQRRSWAPVDGASVGGEWKDRLAVERVEVTFFDSDNNSYPQWPPANRPDLRLPRAVELRVIPRQAPQMRLTVALVDDWPERSLGNEEDDSGEISGSDSAGGGGGAQ